MKTQDVLSYEDYADILDRIESQAEYRAERAKLYAIDGRNARAVEGLRIMRTWFKQQANDSPLMVRLGAALTALYSSDPDTVIDFVPSIDERLSRFNFHNFNENDDPAEFFENLIQAIEEHVAGVRE